MTLPRGDEDTREVARTNAITRVMAGTVGLSIAAAPGLWWTDGWLSPIAIVPVPAVVLRALVIAIGACAPVVAVGVRTRWTVPMLALLLVLRAAPDRALWQSYVLEWCTGLAVAGWAVQSSDRAPVANRAFAWMLGLLFAWAGVHKLNPDFVAEGLGPLVARFGVAHVPAAANVVLALIEVALGVGLVVPRTRRVAAIGLVVWSLVAAAGLAILGLNRAVVPWNVGHAVMLAWLGIVRGSDVVAARDASTRSTSSPRAKRIVVGAIVLVFGVLPALYVIGWPPYLALRLYTGSSMQALLYVDDRGALPDAARRVARADETRTFRLVVDVQRWAHEATGAFLPPEQPVFGGVLDAVCERARDRRRVLLVLVPAAQWWDREPATRYLRCVISAEGRSPAPQRPRGGQ